MSLVFRRVALVVLLSAVVAGCSSVRDAKDSVAGWINGGDGTLTTQGEKKAAGGSGP
jgi:uncharacterized protein YceK